MSHTIGETASETSHATPVRHSGRSHIENADGYDLYAAIGSAAKVRIDEDVPFDGAT